MLDDLFLSYKRNDRVMYLVPAELTNGSDVEILSGKVQVFVSLIFTTSPWCPGSRAGIYIPPSSQDRSKDSNAFVRC